MRPSTLTNFENGTFAPAQDERMRVGERNERSKRARHYFRDEPGQRTRPQGGVGVCYPFRQSLPPTLQDAFLRAFCTGRSAKSFGDGVRRRDCTVSPYTELLVGLPENKVSKDGLAEPRMAHKNSERRSEWNAFCAKEWER
jgi:hypothetical protein